jgi:hypothetical protein
MGKEMKISKGNSKMGRIPSISFPPILACGKNVPCRRECYAMKVFRQYKNTRLAYEHNYRQAMGDRNNFFQELAVFLEKKTPKFFRYHVSGDILDADYLARIKDVAVRFPGTKFFMFTKRTDLLPETNDSPSNLAIIVSVWPGHPMATNLHGYRYAYMQDGTEGRIPEGSVHCPGNCETCGVCASIYSIGKDVYFDKH